MLRYWWAFVESKYWCNHCYFQCWHTTNLQFILLFTTLFIQPVQIEPQPPLHLLDSLIPSPTIPPPLSNFAFPLDLCLMSWPGSDRHYTQDCLQREKHRPKCHTDRNNPCDKHKWMNTNFLSLTNIYTFMHTNMHNHIRNSSQSTQI